MLKNIFFLLFFKLNIYSVKKNWQPTYYSLAARFSLAILQITEPLNSRGDVFNLVDVVAHLTPAVLQDGLNNLLDNSITLFESNIRIA